MPRRKQKIKYSRKIVCKNLEPKGNISNSLQSLCHCVARDLTLGSRAYVCQVCTLYDPGKNSQRFSEVYEESKKIAEKKIREKQIRLEEFEIAEITSDDEIDLSIDEFEEEDEEVPLKFEKRKAGKATLDDSEIEGINECPFCEGIFEDLASHIQNCEFAPDDASIEDVLPSRPKKKKKKVSTASEDKSNESAEKKICPYCGKEFVRLGRHLNSCPKKPADTENDEE